MPHEFSGLRAEEVTIAEVLSDAGYATAFYGKGHLGDIEERYLHNQGFDDALFTPMNQITSLYSPQGNAVNAVLGLHPEIYPPDPYRLDSPGLVPEGWVQKYMPVSHAEILSARAAFGPAMGIWCPPCDGAGDWC